jgi:hypothetical protein
MELKFQRKLSRNHLGHTYVNIPIEVSKALNCDFIDLVVVGDNIKIIPANGSKESKN